MITDYLLQRNNGSDRNYKTVYIISKIINYATPTRNKIRMDTIYYSWYMCSGCIGCYRRSYISYYGLMRNKKRIDNLLGGLFAAKKAQAILLFTTTGTRKKRKHYKPIKSN